MCVQLGVARHHAAHHHHPLLAGKPFGKHLRRTRFKPTLGSRARNALPGEFVDRYGGGNGFAYVDVYVNCAKGRCVCHHPRLVEHSLCVPAFVVAAPNRWQRRVPLHHLLQGKRLAQRLTVVLVNPFRRAVSRHNHQRNMGIVGLGSCRRKVEQRSARGAHHSHRTPGLLCDAYGYVSCRALVSHHHFAQPALARHSHQQRRVAAARTAIHPLRATLGKYLCKPSASVVCSILVLSFHFFKITHFSVLLKILRFIYRFFNQ